MLLPFYKLSVSTLSVTACIVKEKFGINKSQKGAGLPQEHPCGASFGKNSGSFGPRKTAFSSGITRRCFFRRPQGCSCSVWFSKTENIRRGPPASGFQPRECSFPAAVSAEPAVVQKRNAAGDPPAPPESARCRESVPIGRFGQPGVAPLCGSRSKERTF